jgi:hypothetical protein
MDKKDNDIIELPINLNEEKYIIKIYPSRDNINLVFKLEKEKIQTYYYFEKFDLRDFRQANKIFISDYDIKSVFIRLKDISNSYSILLEKKELRMILIFRKEIEKSDIKFILRKKIVSQDRLNPLLVQQIQENKLKIEMMKEQILKLDISLQTKNEVITNINNNLTHINNIIYNINLNNSINSTKNSSSNESNSEQPSTPNVNNNNDEEEEDISSDEKEKTSNYQKQTSQSKKNNSRRTKKNKKKKMKIVQKENKNTNNNNSFFCQEGTEFIQNKKVIELLFILNFVTILIVMYLLGSIFGLKSRVVYENINDEDFMDKLAFVSYNDESNDEEYDNMRDMFTSNIENNLKKKEEEKITSSKEDFINYRKRKIQERKKKYNK